MQRAPSCTAVTIEQTSRSIALSINTCVTQRTRRGRTISAVALLALLAGCEIKRPPPPASPNGRCWYRKLSFDRKTAAAILPAWCGRATRSISASVSPARSWLVNVGNRVGAGDVVAKLDPQDQKLQAQSAQAELAGRDFEPLPGGSRSCALHDVERPRLCLARGLRPQEGGERRSAQGRLDRAVGWAKDAQRRVHPRQKGWARFALATLWLS